jgi:hypothetical protein
VAPIRFSNVTPPWNHHSVSRVGGKKSIQLVSRALRSRPTRPNPRRRRLIGEMSAASRNATTIISATYEPSSPPLALKSGETIHRRHHPTTIIPASRTPPKPTPKASDRGNVRGVPERHHDHFRDLRAQLPALGVEIRRDDPPAPSPHHDHSGLGLARRRRAA